MDGNHIISGQTSRSAAATATTLTDSSSGVTNELRENSTLSAGSATVPPPPDGVQVAYSIPNETQISSTPRELNYSQPNARPPGTGIVNNAYQYDSSKDSKDDLPSYEDAIKAMESSDQYQARRVISDSSDYMQYYRYPDHGQFGIQDQYFYPQSYHSYYSSESSVNLRRSACARLVTLLIFLGFFGAFTMKLLFFTG